MFSRHHRKARLLFGLSDVLIVALAFEAAYQARIFLSPYFDQRFFLIVPTKALLLGTAAVVWLAIGYWLEIYDKLDSAYLPAILRDTFRQCATGTICLVLVEYLLRLDLSRGFLFLFAITSWIFLCLFRWKAGRLVGFMRREFGGPHYVMVVGAGERAERLGSMLQGSSDYGIRLLEPLDEDNALRRLPSILREQIVDEIIFAVDSQKLRDLEEIFLLCDEEGVRTRVAVDFFPHVNSDLYLDRLGSAPLLTFSAAPHDEIRLFLKRAIDVVLAAVALVLLSPFMVLIAALIKLTSPGPAIFRQIRCGLNGRRFVFYKFRSMCENAEQLKAGLAHLNKKDEVVFKIPADPRLTPIGRWIRKFSIDEWPQLWNVLRGDMALVGPRPAIPEEVEQYKRWQRRRLRMRPGLTCLWAISGRDHLDFETWMKMDMQYIDNWSLALDWKIILRTIPSVLLGKGAH